MLNLTQTRTIGCTQLTNVNGDVVASFANDAAGAFALNLFKAGLAGHGSLINADTGLYDVGSVDQLAAA